MAVSLTNLGVNPDRLAHAQATPAGGVLYTAPGSNGGRARAQLSSVIVCNPSSTPLTVRLGLIPQGGTADGTHYLIADKVIDANDTLVLDTPVTLRPGDQLEAQSATLPAPSWAALLSPFTASSGGGTLAAGTYYYRITATNAAGETIASTVQTVTTTGSTSSVVLNWLRSLGATGYKVYRGTVLNSETLIGTVTGGATITFTDTGFTGTTAFPTTGTAAGCIFTLSGSELPA